MSRYSGPDPYVDPASGVLRNRFGITDQAVLESTEADLVASRSRELASNPIQGGFDLKHLQAIHRYLFGDVYDWAGQLRTVDISKNGNLFAHQAYIAGAAEAIFQALAKENRLLGLAKTTFSARAAYFMSEMNALHPFREGNGRTQREFISHLSLANGYYIAWEQVSASDSLLASMEAFQGKLAKLTAIIQANIEPLAR
jgi:fido (protein-threonine AMPylation protein)